MSGRPKSFNSKGCLFKEGTVKGIFFFVLWDASFTGMIKLINDTNG